MAQLPVEHRTVGVVSRNDAKMCSGYTLFNASRETYLINEDGQMVHQWRSRRPVFISYLLPSGNLLRDGGVGSDSGFQGGGAAGVVEEVTWDNTLVWVYDFYPYRQYLGHHDLEPLPNGHVLVLAWERKTKQQALDSGRRSDLIPDGEVWNNLVLELKPEGGSASIVWQWSMWDHIIQDINPSLPNYGNISEHCELFDINFCPVGGKTGQRNRTVLQQGSQENASGLALFGGKDGKEGNTGEKDWLHVNCVSYDHVRDQILLCNHMAGEFMIIDHGTTSEEAKGHSGGKRGKGGDILYRFGNPVVCRQGVLEDQILFCPHSSLFLRDAPGHGNVLVFNNGRAPDRLFSTVEEYELPDQDGNFKCVTQRVAPVWSFGPKQGKLGSFYSTHMSGSQRLPNGNTLITMGPQGIVFEVTSEGEEVWRYINPVRMDCAGAVAFVRQGDFRTAGRFSLFSASRYPDSYPAFASRSLHAGRHLEESYLP